jgi:DNA-binding MarR family transcriptional regulator
MSSGSVSPHQLAQLPPEARATFVTAYADSLQTVFLVAAPIGAIAFLVTLLLPEVRLRAAVGGRGEAAAAPFTPPEGRTSLQEVERQLADLLARENRPAMYRRLAARASLELEPEATWLLYRFDEHPVCSVADVARRIGVPSGEIAPVMAHLQGRGWVRRNPPGSEQELELTPAGRAVIDRLTAARRDGLAELLSGWNPAEHPELAARLRELAHELLADDARMLRDAAPEPARVSS